MKLTLFNGGLHTKPAPHLIRPEESVTCVNMDLDKGPLTPVKDSVQAIANAQPYGYYYDRDDEWYFNATPADWLEYQGALYFSDRITTPIKYINGVPQQLGLIKPEPPLGADLSVFEAAPAQGSSETPAIVKTRLEQGTVWANTLRPGTTFQHRFVWVRTINGRQYRYAGEPDSYYIGYNNPAVDPPYVLDVYTVIPSGSTIAVGDTLELYREYQGEWRRAQTGTVTAHDTELVFRSEIQGIGANFLLPSYLSGTYRYAVTYKNSVTQVETSPYITSERAIDNNNITVSGLVKLPSGSAIDTLVLYRLGGALTVYTKVDEFAVSSLPIDEEVGGVVSYIFDYLDDKKDSTLSGQLETQDYASPEKLKYLVETYAVFFAVVEYGTGNYLYPNRLHFTPVDQPETWPRLNFLTFPTDITGLAVVANGLLVFTLQKTYLVTGNTPATFNQRTLSNSQGCVKHETIASLGGGALWVSQEGICISDGSAVDILTTDKLDKQQFNAVNAVTNNQKYYLQLTDGRTFEADLKTGKFRYLDLNITSLVTGGAVLYGYRASFLRELFADQTKLPLSYKSAKFVQEGYTSTKIYKYLYVASEGEVNLTVFINGNFAKLFTFSGDLQLNEVLLPADHTMGQELQIVVTGTGTVYEIYLHEASPNR